MSKWCRGSGKIHKSVRWFLDDDNLFKQIYFLFKLYFTLSFHVLKKTHCKLLYKNRINNLKINFKDIF